MIENLIWARFLCVLPPTPAQIENIWSQKRAIIREVLGEKLLLREATPDLSHDQTVFDYVPSKGLVEIADWKINPVLLGGIKEFLNANTSARGERLRFKLGQNNRFGLWLMEPSRGEIHQLKKNLQEWNWTVELGTGDYSTPCCWQPSYAKDNSELEIKSFISSPAESGPETNRVQIALALELLEAADFQPMEWAMDQAGYGNFAAALTSFLGKARFLVEREPSLQFLLKQTQAFCKVLKRWTLSRM